MAGILVIDYQSLSGRVGASCKLINSTVVLQIMQPYVFKHDSVTYAVWLEDIELPSRSSQFSKYNGFEAYMGAKIEDGVSFTDKA
jgi:hypothetical protein